MSARVSGFLASPSPDPLTSERILELRVRKQNPRRRARLHDGPNMSSAQKQAAMISNRPDGLR